jgi:hypothetical protein
VIEAVLTLHEKAKMVLCDLKPGNQRWRNGIVRFIDLEHAQDIIHGAWALGTVLGFQAPEILNELTCSTRTGAFWVGTIISSRMQVAAREKCHSPQQMELWDKLHNVSMKVTDTNRESRWSLSNALDAIHHDKQQHSDLSTVN